MKNDGQAIRDSFPWISQCTKDPHWLNNAFLFSTEIWAEQLKKAPCIFSSISVTFSCKAAIKSESITKMVFTVGGGDLSEVGPRLLRVLATTQE